MKYSILGFLILVSGGSVAVAETTSFQQQVLPIDCIYEVINVGTQQLRYITPDTCPIDPGPPVVTDPAREETTVPSSDGTAPVRPTWRYQSAASIAGQPSSAPEASQIADAQQPSVQGTIERIDDIIVDNRDALALIMFVSIFTLFFYSFVLRRNMRK